MDEEDLPPAWRLLLEAAQERPDGILFLEDGGDEETDTIAERLTDLGLFRIVTARRYRLTEAGRAALASIPREDLSMSGAVRVWLRRLFGGRHQP